MDILNMLRAHITTFTNEELDVIIKKIKTDGYSKEYVRQCMDFINDYLEQKKKLYKTNSEIKKTSGLSIIQRKKDIINHVETKPLSRLEQFYKDFSVAKSLGNTKDVLIEFIDDKTIDPKFIMENISIFNDDDWRTILEKILFTPEDLNILINVVKNNIIESTQIITEDFFFKHFDSLSINCLKRNKVTDWITDNGLRSTKMNIFIKVKGIKL